MKHGNYQHDWLLHYCQDLGFVIDHGRELWLNVRSKPCVKPSKGGRAIRCASGARGTSEIDIWAVLKSAVRMVLCKFSKQFILAL